MHIYIYLKIGQSVDGGSVNLPPSLLKNALEHRKAMKHVNLMGMLWGTSELVDTEAKDERWIVRAEFK